MKKIIIKVIPVCSFLLLGVLLFLLPDPKYRPVAQDVTVVDEAGVPIQGATVSIECPSWLHRRPVAALVLHGLGMIGG